MRPNNDTDQNATAPDTAPSQVTSVSARMFNKADLNHMSRLLAMHSNLTAQRLSVKAIAIDVSPEKFSKADLYGIANFLAEQVSFTAQRLSLKAIATDLSARKFSKADLNRISRLLAMHHFSYNARKLCLKSYIATNIVMCHDGIERIILRTSVVAKLLGLSLSGARKIKSRIIRELGGCRLDHDLVQFGSRPPSDPCTPAPDNVVHQSIEPTTDEAPATSLNLAKRLQELLDYRWDII